MGALAAQDNYDVPYPPDMLQRPPRSPAAIPEPVERGIGSVAKAADYYVGMPSRQMAPIEPTVPGMWSEEDEFRQQKKNEAGLNWGTQTGIGMVFDPLGVRRGVAGAGASLGSGAPGGKIIQPQPRMGELADLAQPALTGEVRGPMTLRPALGGVSAQQQAKLGPMVSQLEKLGATPEQINAFTPQQAYDFVKARNMPHDIHTRDRR
jgi:hypothetical protein